MCPRSQWCVCVCVSELLRAERLQVCVLGSSSVVLQWRPVFRSDLGTFGLHYKPDPSDGPAHTHTHTTLTLPGDSSWAELTGLWPDTAYTAWLAPGHSIPYGRNLSVSFRTLPGERATTHTFLTNLFLLQFY